MSLIYALGAFFLGYLAFREYLKRRAESEKGRAVPFFLLSLLLAMMGMCGLFGFLGRLIR
jgi:hypothetical protein